MFESIVNEKASREVKKLEFYENVDTTIIGKSNLSPFVKNFIISEAPHVSTNEELEQQVNKAVKLLINYSIRPKWTILNFVFGSLDSKRVEEVSAKLAIFPFYKFYTEVIEEYVDRNSADFITKKKAELLIDEMNLDLKEKLTQNISGIKIKNFLLNVFKLKHENESQINLDSDIPYTFIKIFLTDKGYEDLVTKFESLNYFKDNDFISYKDIIKILTDKFVPPTEPVKEKPEAKIEVKKQAPAEKIVKSQEAPNERKKIEIDFSDDAKKPVTEKVTEEKKPETPSAPVKKEPTQPVKIELKPQANTEETKPVKEKTYSRYDIYSNERDDEKKKAQETELAKEPAPQDEQLEVIESVKHNEDTDDTSISGLFTENEKKQILSRIYNNSKSAMRASFKELNEVKTWDGAIQHLKQIILANKVDIYHKKIVFFVDMLHEHFIKKGK